MPSVRSWTLGKAGYSTLNLSFHPNPNPRPRARELFQRKKFRPPARRRKPPARAAGSHPPAASVRPPPTRQLGRPTRPPFRSPRPPSIAVHHAQGALLGRSARALPRGRRRPQPGLLGGKALAAGRPVARPLRKAPAPSRQRAQAPSSQRCLVAAGRPCSAPGDYRRCHGEAWMPLP